MNCYNKRFLFEPIFLAQPKCHGFICINVLTCKISIQSLSFFFFWFSPPVQRNEPTGNPRIKPGGCIPRLQVFCTPNTVRSACLWFSNCFFALLRMRSKLEPVNAPVETYGDNSQSLALDNYLLIISCHIMKNHFMVADIDLHQQKIFWRPSLSVITPTYQSFTSLSLNISF